MRRSLLQKRNGAWIILIVSVRCGVILITWTQIGMQVRMDITQIRFVIFDVGQTLLFLTPSSEEVLFDRCQQLAIDVALEDLKRGCKVGELWVAETIMREQKGAPRMSDEEFDRKWEYVVLEVALKGREENINDLVKKFQDVHGPIQDWSAPPETYTVLDKLRAKGMPLGIVSNFQKT